MCVCMCPLVVSLFIVFFRGCHRQPLYCFHLDFRCVTLIRYIYIYVGFRAKTRLRAYAHNCQETEKM